MKAEHFGRAKSPDLAATVRAAEGMGGIEHQLQAVARCDFLQRLDWAGAAPQVHGQYAARAGRDSRLDALRVDQVCAGVDVAEYRSDLLRLQRVAVATKVIEGTITSPE